MRDVFTAGHALPITVLSKFTETSKLVWYFPCTAATLHSKETGTCSPSSQPPLPLLPASIVAAVTDPDILLLTTVKHVYWLGTD